MADGLGKAGQVSPGRSVIVGWVHIAGDIVVGCCIVIMFLLCSAMVILSFSAYQFQIAYLAERQSKETLPPLSTVLGAVDVWNSVSLERDTYLLRLAEIRNEQIRIKDVLSDLSRDRVVGMMECRNELASVINAIAAGLNKPVLNVRDPAKLSCIRNALLPMLQKVDGTRGKKDDVQPSANLPEEFVESAIKDAKLKALLDEGQVRLTLRLTQDENDAATQKLNRVKMDQLGMEARSFEDRITEVDQSIRSKLAASGLEGSLGDYLNTLVFLDTYERAPYVGVVIPDFSHMPPDSLVLILVLAMGSLGSTIIMARSFLSRGATSPEFRKRGEFRFYVYRPFLGAVTALVVFILAKAGVLVFSSGQSVNGNTNLSPYFISFLAIISGMLSEQALSTIIRNGRRYFADTSFRSRDRWGYGLKREIMEFSKADKEGDEKFSKSMKDLPAVFGVPTDIWNKWVDEKTTVPEHFQDIIAAYFRKDLRLIFTDFKTSSPFAVVNNDAGNETQADAPVPEPKSP